MSKELPKGFDPNKTINANLWRDMSLSQLYAQELMIQSKVEVAQQVNNASMETQLIQGLTLIQEYIKLYAEDDSNHKVTVIGIEI